MSAVRWDLSRYISHLKFGLPAISTVPPILHDVLRLGADFIRRTSGRKVGKLKNHCRISGSFRRNSHFHVSRLRHCPGNAKLSYWKETINILTLHTRIHRYVVPPPVPILGAFAELRKCEKLLFAV